MSKWKILFNGSFEDEVYDIEEEAEEEALYLVSCTKQGAEILHMSNPGDYDEDDYDADSFVYQNVYYCMVKIED